MAEVPHNPRIGVVADTTLKRHLLCSTVKKQGYELSFAAEPSTFDEKWFESDELDVWLVDLAEGEGWREFLDRLLEISEVPILFGDGQTPVKETPQFPRWERRLCSKLVSVVGRPLLEEDLQAIAEGGDPVLELPEELVDIDYEYVWVLGASLGGPAAVKTFLDALPPAVPAAFFLAQHIDAGMIESYSQILSRGNEWTCEVAKTGSRLEKGKILLAPIETAVEFNKAGFAIETGEQWQEPYAPSIDQAIHAVAEIYGSKTGVILFSGMGNDGAIAGPILKGRGGRVWVQDSESCACSSQPDSCRETGAVEFVAPPYKLAKHLVEFLQSKAEA